MHPYKKPSNDHFFVLYLHISIYTCCIRTRKQTVVLEKNDTIKQKKDVTSEYVENSSNRYW